MDEIIECLVFGDERRTVSLALQQAAPQAYDKKVAVRKVWAKLREPVQAAIVAAWEKEMGPLLAKVEQASGRTAAAIERGEFMEQQHCG